MSTVNVLLQFALAPILTAIVASYGTLFAIRRANRRVLIEEWKNKLLDSSLYFDHTKEQLERQSITVSFSDTGMVNPETSFNRLIRLSSFASFKPHMSKASLEKLENYNGYRRKDGKAPHRVTTIIVGATENPVRGLIANEIHRLEKKWWLI